MTPKYKVILVKEVATPLVLASPVESNADVTGTNANTAYKQAQKRSN